jgi:hypothetical protein
MAVGYLAGIAQFYFAAILHPGGNFHPELFPPPNQVFFQSLSGLLSGNGYLIADFGTGRRFGLWLAEYLLQVDAARRFEAYPPPAAGASTESAEGESSALGHTAEDIVQEIKAQAGAAEVLHQVFEGGAGEGATEDVADVADGAELVELLSFLRVTENAESLIDFLELLVGPLLFARVAVGMELHRQLPVYLLYLLLAGSFRHAKNLVVVLCHSLLFTCPESISISQVGALVQCEGRG